MNPRFFRQFLSCAAVCVALTASAQSLEPQSVYPADGSVLRYVDGYSLSSVNMTFGQSMAVRPDVMPWLVDAEGNRHEASRVRTGAALMMPETVIINFDDADTLPSSVYTLVVPEGMVGSLSWEAGGYTSGDCNAALELVYTYEGDPALVSHAPDDDGQPLELTTLTLRTGGHMYNLLEPGQEIAGLRGHSVFTIGSNKNYLAEAVYMSIYNLTDDEEVRTYWTYDIRETVDRTVTVYGKNAAGDFEVDTTHDQDFYAGCDYELTVGFYYKYDGVAEDQRVCYGTAVIPFAGTTPRYEYSPAEMLEVTPDPAVAQPWQLRDGLSIRFSQPVEISSGQSGVYVQDGEQMMLYLFKSIEGFDNNTLWQFEVNPMALDSYSGQVLVYIAGTDSQGLVLTVGESNHTYTMGSKADRVVVLVYDDSTVGTEVPTLVETEPEAVYDLQGRRAAEGTSGLRVEVTPQGGRIILRR